MQQGLGRGDRAGGAGLVASAPGRSSRRSGGRLAKALGVAQPLALDPELLELVRLRGDGLDLGELVAEQVEVALPRAVALAQLRQLGLEGEGPAMDSRYFSRRARCSVPAKPSRISVWAEEIVSLRCSCWP